MRRGFFSRPPPTPPMASINAALTPLSRSLPAASRAAPLPTCAGALWKRAGPRRAAARKETVHKPARGRGEAGAPAPRRPGGGEEGFAGPGGPDKQPSLGDPPAEPAELGWHLEEFDDLLQLVG